MIKFNSLTIVLIIFLTAFNPSSSNSQVPVLSDFDEKVYFGYEYGTSGIINTLLELQNAKLPDFNLDLIPLIEFTLEQVWNDRINSNRTKYASWPKMKDFYSIIYPGQKYGPAGIFLTFINLYNTTEDIKWLQRAEEGYWLLASQALNSTTQPRWPYSYKFPNATSGTSTTDLKYGTSGILYFNMLLYKITKNSSYLDHGRLLISSLKEMSTKKIIDEQTYSVIPWYYPNGEETIMTGYNWGLTGIAPLLYRYANILNDESLKTWSLELTDFILAIQEKDGGWKNEYLGKDSITGFDDGVSGILYGLYEMQQLSGLKKYSDSIINGISWLFSQFINNQTHKGFFYDNYRTNVYTSLYRGSIGILRILTSMKEYLNENQYSNVIDTYKWLLTNGSIVIEENKKELFLLLYNPMNYEYIDFSFAEGLAGLLSELIRLKQNEKLENDINIDIDKFLILTVDTLLYFQDDFGYWNRQILIDQNWDFYRFKITSQATTPVNGAGFEILMIGMAIIGIFIYRKRR
ncbi:MAG: hypothetical protein HeimC3_48200 [Candidatus Heimdallarchaeota archaeon LC_3]|nr:MAG: hypothetical protein HeimC3_48200 [Candidatus Heimdallarchaeota archaeon LC_3]